jgi:hypothetical protein
MNLGMRIVPGFGGLTTRRDQQKRGHGRLCRNAERTDGDERGKNNDEI